MSHGEAVEFIGNWFSQFPADVVTCLLVVVGFFAVVGDRSVDFLRGLPEFEHKAEMLWGARWLWAVMLAIPTVAYLVMYEGITRTAYPVTSVLAALLIFQFGFVVLLPLLGDQAAGCFAVLDLVGAWFKRKPFDVSAWIAHEQEKLKRQRLYAAMGALGFVMSGLLSYGQLSRSYRVEREIAELYRGLPLVIVLKQELHSLLVEGVFIERALTREPYELVVRVRRDTTAKQADDVARRTERALASLGEPRQWLIHVVRRGEKARQREALTESMYVPHVRPKASPSSRAAPSREPERQDASRGPAGIGSRAPQGREFATERGMMDSPRRTREEVGAHAS